jgi:hypothetical protein
MPFSDCKPHFLAAGVVGHQRRDADAEVDVEAVLEFLRRAGGHLVLVPRHGQTPAFSVMVRFSMRFSAWH